MNIFTFEERGGDLLFIQIRITESGEDSSTSDNPCQRHKPVMSDDQQKAKRLQKSTHVKAKRVNKPEQALAFLAISLRKMEQGLEHMQKTCTNHSDEELEAKCDTQKKRRARNFHEDGIFGVPYGIFIFDGIVRTIIFIHQVSMHRYNSVKFI